MDASVTTVNLENASLSAQQARSSTAIGSSGDKGLFAQQLARVQAAREESQAPTSLNASEKDAENVEKTPKTPQIARSWRMSGAEKATEVQENLDLDWDDALDLLNPLQHIPIVGTIYRELTGDTISPEIQIAGSVAFGALTGSIAFSAVAGIAGAAYEQSTGQEPTIQIAQALFGEETIGGSAIEAGEIRLAAASEPPLSLPVSPHSLATPEPEQKMAQFSTGSMRIGNVIHAAPSVKPAAYAAKATDDVSKAVAEARDAMVLAETTPSKDENLGELMQQQAKIKQTGSSLPPQLVHDMMLMALDKYKTAQALSEEAPSLP